VVTATSAGFVEICGKNVWEEMKAIKRRLFIGSLLVGRKKRPREENNLWLKKRG